MEEDDNDEDADKAGDGLQYVFILYAEEVAFIFKSNLLHG